MLHTSIVVVVAGGGAAASAGGGGAAAAAVFPGLDAAVAVVGVLVPVRSSPAAAAGCFVFAAASAGGEFAFEAPAGLYLDSG